MLVVFVNKLFRFNNLYKQACNTVFIKEKFYILKNHVIILITIFDKSDVIIPLFST